MFEAVRYWRVLFPGLRFGVVLWAYLPALSHALRLGRCDALFRERLAPLKGGASFENIFAPMLAGTTHSRPPRSCQFRC